MTDSAKSVYPAYICLSLTLKNGDMITFPYFRTGDFDLDAFLEEFEKAKDLNGVVKIEAFVSEAKDSERYVLHTWNKGDDPISGVTYVPCVWRKECHGFIPDTP